LTRVPIPVVAALDGDARGAATTLALWSDATVSYLTTALGCPGAMAGLVPLGALVALRVRSEARTSMLAAPLRAELGAAGALATLLAAERVDSAHLGGTLGLLGDRWLVTVDRDGLLETAADLARALARGVPERPLASRKTFAEVGQITTASSLLAELDPTARSVVEVLARALRSAGTVEDLLRAERAAVIELLTQPAIREKAAATLQALSAPRR
ncbi:MAG: 3-hydroxyacyl-CoA dehydrogenase, partial [Thermomicrobium sp.]